LELLEQAKNGRHALIKKLQGKRVVKDKKEFGNDPIFKEAMDAICDDLNTPKLLAVVQNALTS
jgi:cysteinyl-tRNA synthetase